MKTTQKTTPPEKPAIKKKTFDIPVELAFGLARLSMEESMREGRNVPETEIIQRLIRSEVDRAAKLK